MTCGALPTLSLADLRPLLTTLRFGPTVESLYLADDDSVWSLSVGEPLPCLGLLISERSGSGASSNRPSKLASEDSSGVRSCKVPANSGCVSAAGLSEYDATSFWPCDGDGGESGDSPCVVKREFVNELTKEPRLNAALNLPLLALAG